LVDGPNVEEEVLKWEKEGRKEWRRNPKKWFF